MLSASPTSVTSRSDSTRSANPETSAPTAVAAGERAEREALLVGAAVEHAVDEDGAADDRGRERVAGEQRDEGRGRERQDPEQPRVEERVGAAQARAGRRGP